MPSNHAPTATANNQAATSGQVLNASSLVSANDVDGDSLQYFFDDNTPGAASGHFEVNGVAQAAGTTFSVNPAQLAQTTFTAGTIADDLFVNVYDGLAFSGPKPVPRRHRVMRGHCRSGAAAAVHAAASPARAPGPGAEKLRRFSARAWPNNRLRRKSRSGTEAISRLSGWLPPAPYEK